MKIEHVSEARTPLVQKHAVPIQDSLVRKTENSTPLKAGMKEELRSLLKKGDKSP